MNCLITAIGSFSAEAVIESLRKNHIARIIGCDIYPYAWIPIASSVDTFYQVPIVYENELYIDKLIEIIAKEKINFIFPLTDPEVDILSKYRDEIEKHNVTICMPNDKIVNICRDKLAFYEFFKDDRRVNLIPTLEPSKFSLNFCDFPIIAKPKKGRSSEGIFIIDTEDELKIKLVRLQNHILQPLKRGDIYTVDLIRDEKHKKSFAMSRKELIRTKNGAGLSVEVSSNKYLEKLTQYIGEKLNINGCINMEFLFADNKYYLMDINPRFSAGISFSILAGYDMVINHLNCFLGNETDNPIKYRTMIIAKKLSDVITSDINNKL